MVSVGVSSWGKRSWYSSILQWRSMAHITVMCFSLNSYCLSCRRSRETSSCSKTVLQCTTLATQSNFKNGRHPRSLHQTCAPPQYNSPDLNPTRYWVKCNSGSTRQKFMTWMNWSSVLSMCGRLAVLAGRQNIIDDAIDEWRKCLRLLACIRAKEDILSICFDSRAGHAYDNFSVLSLWILKKLLLLC